MAIQKGEKKGKKKSREVRMINEAAIRKVAEKNSFVGGKAQKKRGESRKEELREELLFSFSQEQGKRTPRGNCGRGCSAGFGTRSGCGGSWRENEKAKGQGLATE